MTDFNYDEYMLKWRELKIKARAVTENVLQEVEPLEVGNTDLYDPKRTNCKKWELDEGFIDERIHEESLPYGEEAEAYVMEVIKEGPRCELCIWNDGGPKSCVHPDIEDCPHTDVKVTFDWTLYMTGDIVFTGVNWKEESFEGQREKSDGWASDGTKTRIGMVECIKCGKRLEDTHDARVLFDAFLEEW